MNIWDFMDCEGCEDLHHIQGRTGGDPDSYYPDEDMCRQGAPENGPCDRMLGAIEDMIHDGEFETSAGFMVSGEFFGGSTLEELGFSLENMPSWWNGGIVDLSSVSYYFISFDPDVFPVEYKDEEAVYKAFFDG